MREDHGQRDAPPPLSAPLAPACLLPPASTAPAPCPSLCEPTTSQHPYALSFLFIFLPLDPTPRFCPQIWFPSLSKMLRL